jgi:hypothetical protein
MKMLKLTRVGTRYKKSTIYILNPESIISISESKSSLDGPTYTEIVFSDNTTIYVIEDIETVRERLVQANA